MTTSNDSSITIESGKAGAQRRVVIHRSGKNLTVAGYFEDGVKVVWSASADAVVSAIQQCRDLVLNLERTRRLDDPDNPEGLIVEPPSNTTALFCFCSPDHPQLDWKHCSVPVPKRELIVGLRKLLPDYAEHLERDARITRAAYRQR